MKEKILICSIFRNRENSIDFWYQQVQEILNEYKECTFSLSIYENDSVDNTQQKLLSLDTSMFDEYSLISEDINTNYYSSIVNEDRVRNLANARNKCLDSPAIELLKYTKVLFIEPDFRYSLEDAKRILSCEEATNIKFDILSGVSHYNNRFYDSWATRKTENDNEGQLTPANSIEPFWTTFNGFCLYNANPFKEGVRFHWFNKRLNRYDCDTAVICENFREKCYNEIYINRSAIFHHEL